MNDSSDSEDGSDSEDSSDSESEKNKTSDSIHPMDGLLALIHCCDNFLRQDLFSRMATCQIALPLLLPDPSTGELKMLIWAMRTIVKEFALPYKKARCYRIIDYPMPFVSFLRVGGHGVSKSEIINDIMSKSDSDNRNQPFFGYNSPGGSSKKLLVNGLVEVSWYLPGDGLFPTPIAFMNLRGDARDCHLEKQVDFLCEISAVSILFLSSEIFKEDATKEWLISLLKKLSKSKGTSILVQTKREKKEFKEEMSEAVGMPLFESKFRVLKREKSRAVLVNKLKESMPLNILKANEPISLSSHAFESRFALDEQDDKCARGKELMEQLLLVLNGYIGSSKLDGPESLWPEKTLKDLLPLQSVGLWHAWATLDKEQYRQKFNCRHGNVMTQDGEQKHTIELSAKEYSDEKRAEMRTLRIQQYDKAYEKNTASEIMALFLSGIRKGDKMVQKYFIQWLKIALDNLSQKILPPLYAKQCELRSRLSEAQRKRDEEAEKKYLENLKELDQKKSNASLGVEHLMREVGQMYEAVTEQEGISHPECIVRDLPQIAAQMLCDGFTLELLDGDASHMPVKWVKAILKELAKLIQGDSESDPGIYVISVLGIQSTGKSTLLNTMFGVQFSVSAGRCTRGAFMQLIPVHCSLHKKTGVKYFLLIDTEGLRAPQLDNDRPEHDNELATFVIGIADQTLINISGEVAGGMDNVLNAAIIAFMRMSEVNLKPSCHIVHQNVTALAAKSLLLDGRLKTIDKLNKMTEAAAKQTDQDGKYRFFSDVIKFDHNKDVSEFVSLWNGELPMAQVSTGYSKGAQQLKVAVIRKCKSRNYRNTVPLLLSHVSELWNAILQEDFAFTFQNIYEIVAYKALELEFSNCTCKFKTDMNVLQQAAENELYGCFPCELDATLEKHNKIIEEGAWEGFKKYEGQMMDFYKDQDDIMLKWKLDMEKRLENLQKELESNVKQNILQAFNVTKNHNETEKEREKLIIVFQRKVGELTSQMCNIKLSETELAATFNNTWSEWIKTMKFSNFTMPDIPTEVEKCIIDFFPGEWKGVRARIYEGGLKKLHTLALEEKHIKPAKRSMLEKFSKHTARKTDSFHRAQRYTDETFDKVEEFLMPLRSSDENFSSNLVTELLQIVRKRRQPEMEDFEFTYEVELAMTACSKAIPVFEEIAEKFKEKHDPQVYIENEMKPKFKDMFMEMVDRAESEKLENTAERLCRTLKGPINKCILENLTPIIFKEMTRNYVWIKRKETFIGKILLEMGEQLNEGYGVDLCIQFLTDIKSSLEYWARYFTEQHCSSGSPSHISVMAKIEVNSTIDFLIEEAESTSCTLSQSEKVNIREWLKCFHSKIRGKIKISFLNTQYFQDHGLSNIKFFTDQVKAGLESFRNVLCQNVTYAQTIFREKAAHKMVFNTVAGCTQQCPFCGAPCERTNSNHTPDVKHITTYCPQALKKYHWIGYRVPILDVCNYLVSTIINFRNADTNQRDHYYSNYRKFYLDWFIPADRVGKPPLYWKWFIGKYFVELQKRFQFSRIKCKEYDDWNTLQWREVRIEEYGL